METYEVRLLGAMVFVIAASSREEAIREARDRAVQSPGHFTIMDIKAVPEVIVQTEA
jgi:hypothetical protein